MNSSTSSPLRIGVLSLQGAFIEHINILRGLGAEAIEVRLPADLDGLDGLIIPGGESTAIGKLATTYGLMEPLRQFATNKAVWGTCAGMIFMARRIRAENGKDQPLLGVMDITVERNAFGRQVDSFITPLDISALSGQHGEPFPAVFIRGPRLLEADGDARVIARLEDGTPVAAEEGQWLATSFHPELTGDTRFHEHFLEMVAESLSGNQPD